MSDKDLLMLQNLSLDGNPVNLWKNWVIGSRGESADTKKAIPTSIQNAINLGDKISDKLKSWNRMTG